MFKKCLFFICSNMLFSITSYAASGLTMMALNDPVLMLDTSETQTIQYQIINQGHKAYQLDMEPLNGVVQETEEAGFCSPDKLLAKGKSCLLSLQVHADEAMGLMGHGPKLCDQSNPKVCVEPPKTERLSIYPKEHDKLSLSVSIPIPIPSPSSQTPSFGHCFASVAECTLTLFATNTSYSLLSITNNSKSTAYDLTLTGLPFSVVLEPLNQCNPILPGATCNLKFTTPIDQTPTPTPTSVAIEAALSPGGPRKTIKSINLQILGLGGSYQGQQLFILPTAPTYQYATVASSNLVGVTWDDAKAACISSNAILPNDGQLMALYNASTCPLVPGYLLDFDCSGTYWSGIEVSSSVANVLVFVGPTPGSEGKTNPLFARCIKQYVLP